MLESEAEMKYIQEALGHSSIQVTSDVCSHVSKMVESDAINKFKKHPNKIFTHRGELLIEVFSMELPSYIKNPQHQKC